MIGDAIHLLSTPSPCCRRLVAGAFGASRYPMRMRNSQIERTNPLSAMESAQTFDHPVMLLKTSSLNGLSRYTPDSQWITCKLGTSRQEWTCVFRSEKRVFAPRNAIHRSSAAGGVQGSPDSSGAGWRKRQRLLQRLRVADLSGLYWAGGRVGGAKTPHPPPPFIGKTKPTGPLESTNRCPKRPKTKPNEAKRSQIWKNERSK
jgi:hypothetical protein